MKKPDLHFIVDEDFNLFNLNHPIRLESIKPLIFIHSRFRTSTEYYDYFDHRFFNPDHSENRHSNIHPNAEGGKIEYSDHDVCKIKSNGIRIELACIEKWDDVRLPSKRNIAILADIWDKSGNKKRFRFQQFLHSKRDSFAEVFSYLRELSKVNSHQEASKNEEFKNFMG